MSDLRAKIKSRKRPHCIAVERIFDPAVVRLPDNNELKDMIEDLKRVNSVSNVVILWCNCIDAVHIINQAHKEGLQNIWIAVTWGNWYHFRELCTVPNLQVYLQYILL